METASVLYIPVSPQGGRRLDFHNSDKRAMPNDPANSSNLI
jgi:hypothetical protein